MGRAIETDWGFREIARKFESDAVPQQRRQAAERKWLVLPSAGTAHFGAWLFLLALSLIGLVTLHVVILQKNIEHTGIIQEKNSLMNENARLSAEVSALSSPERIESIALGAIGMVPAERMQYVYITPSGDERSYAEVSRPDSGRLAPP